MVILSYIIILSWISRLTILISSYHLSVKCQYRSFLPFHPCPGNPSIQLRPIHHSPSRSAHHEPYQWGKDSGSGSQCAQVDGLKASSLQTIQASTEAVEGNGARFSSSGCTISISWVWSCSIRWSLWGLKTIQLQRIILFENIGFCSPLLPSNMLCSCMFNAGDTIDNIPNFEGLRRCWPQSTLGSARDWLALAENGTLEYSIFPSSRQY